MNTLTGEGLAKALAGTDVVVDLANSPTFQGPAAIEFFEKSGHTLLAAEATAGVRHHIALSVVGTDRLQDSDYFRGKLVQEKLIKDSRIPYTIVRSTQFFEFMSGIADAGTVGRSVHLSPALVQPISSDDVADVMTKAALDVPLNAMIEIAGPERLKLSDLIARYLEARSDPRQVIVDPQARYFGLLLHDGSLVPRAAAHLGATHYERWMEQNGVVRVGSPA